MQKYFIFSFLFTFLSQISLAQNANYSRVKVFLDEKNTIEKLAKLGVETDHGEIALQRYIINDFSKKEIQLIQNQGFRTEVLIADSEDFAISPENTEAAKASIFWQCGTPYNYTHEAPKNFKLGTMAGFYTYQEMIDIFADMQAKYPNLITQFAPIDTFKTFEKRPIQWLKISDNPTKKETGEGQVLYTALHHAREPASLSQLVYFMWYLLENYDKSDEIKYLVNNTALFFVPCVNPDGYVYNQTTKPNGGGYWRKNRRANADATFGVDLNRNYGYEWGKNDAGSSPDGDAETYRGTAPFSEPETSAVRWLCKENNFIAALNYHSFGNYLIYPWANDEILADSSFLPFGGLLTRYNNYLYGTTVETVGYSVNGDAPDWMFGEAKIKALTPEVGTSFWPPSFTIKDICADNLYANLAVASYANHSAVMSNRSLNFTNGYNSKVDFDVKNIGVVSGIFKVKIKALNPAVSLTNAATQNFNPKLFETQKGSFGFSVNANTPIGTTLSFLLSIDNQYFTHYDTVKMFLQKPIPLLAEKGNNINKFEASSNSWGITTKVFVSPPAAISDSPDGNYAANTNANLTLSKAITLPKKSKILLHFWAKWEIERDHDFATIGISTSDNPGFFQLLCGRYTRSGNDIAVYEKPIYDGKSDWVQEEIDISDYAGKSVLLQFQMNSDSKQQFDGIYIDDIQIWAENTLNSMLENIAIEDFTFSASPNPTSDYLKIKTESSIAEKNVELLIFDISGRICLQKNIQNTDNEYLIHLDNFKSGVYFYQLRSERSKNKPQKLIIVK
jgi:carboxypeptidase T